MGIGRIAVVGAGVSGLACARRLVSAGHDVQLFDKGRGVGGRAATRRIAVGGEDVRFDHGAQFFTARTAAFRAVVDDLFAAGWVSAYPNKVGVLTAGGYAPAPHIERFTGKQGMNGLAKGLAVGLQVATSQQVAKLQANGSNWELQLADGRTEGPFDAVAIAIPAEQAASLLAPASPTLVQEAQAARTLPCWAVMISYPDRIKSAFEAATIEQGAPVAWAAKMDPEGASWVLHATPKWTQAHIDDAPEEVGSALTQVFSNLTGASARPQMVAAHRWRYAQVEVATASDFGFDPATRIGVCGDWRLGPRIELAWQSGDALGVAMAGAISGL